MKGAEISSTQRQATCHVRGRDSPVAQMPPWISVSPTASELIAIAAPGWAAGKHIYRPDIAQFCREYVERLLPTERGELHGLDWQMIANMEAGIPVTRNPAKEAEDRYTFSERLADHVGEFGGSWTFIPILAGILILWVVINIAALNAQSCAPYTFMPLTLCSLASPRCRRRSS